MVLKNEGKDNQLNFQFCLRFRATEESFFAFLVKGMEYDPERGHRCTECFDMRMERTALYAHEHGFHAIATTNSTSRWKDGKQVDDSGFRCAAKYEGLKYWAYNWQSDEMTLRKYQVRA